MIEDFTHNIQEVSWLIVGISMYVPMLKAFAGLQLQIKIHNRCPVSDTCCTELTCYKIMKMETLIDPFNFPNEAQYYTLFIAMLCFSYCSISAVDLKEKSEKRFPDCYVYTANED